ncbi:antibiotic transport system ATP-binding protein [Thermotomaculum hydrothermale]|uniref:Antibiotic transport system ATP-binding protein n=1 Tax=Thermotomaculum hydrothermale TaxID=981385 RepID=A0A7R6PGN5_9BACT|nr:ABC transporter ATP-binding protein [Thermotomaculum hydrothermale]BBB32274.1 antibiotic transport system ATP-binding protein [Thermotomaculum hydrothermale]
MPLLKIENLTKSYPVNFFKSKTVIENLSLEIEKGKVYALLGRNGAGKTTLLNCVLGLINYKGRIFYKDTELNRKTIKQALKTITSAPSPIEMFPNLSLNQYLPSYRMLYSNWDNELLKKIKEFTEFDWDKPFKSLSNGQKMQALQVLTLCPSPDLIILDEPLGVTDPVVRKYFYRTLIDIIAEKETTLIIATHLINEIENLFDTAIIMKNGKIVMQESMDKLQTRYKKFTLEKMPDTKIEGEIGRFLGEKALLSENTEKTSEDLKQLGIKHLIANPTIEDIFEIFA